ncbi:hypothetical protein [Streptomyces lunaelactis]|uniref:hypothetical protein n=1 Tax=Streptomyces lunaelactis TaxID=1535768 RepID=UPI001584D62C|nr:hypothetical protein [Streptomyces lunaelactis]NUL09065.1 hypothetical protein [Streptomyces lunaelactis]
MFIVYTPAGGEPEHYDARSLLVSEVSIVSRTIDMKWPQIKEGLAEDDLDAMRGVAWVLKKRSNPSLRWADWDPGVEEMVTRLDKTEVETYVAGAVAIARQDPEVTGAQIVEALKDLPPVAMDPAHAEAVIKEMAADPKDEPALEVQAEQTPSDPSEPSPSPALTSSESNTSGSSPTSATSGPETSTP